tara:strand:- start:695 stop:1534 length:840 start_codon:yes stop_codon:yes gene_type:complete
MSINSYDNIIHKDLIDTVKEECKKMHHYSTKTIGVIRDNKYTTFWLGKDDPPQSFIEYIVKNISIQDHPNGFPKDYSGIEWWSQVRDTKEGIIFHYDKDEGTASLYNNFIHPIRTTITYLTNVGGPTTIFSDENYNNGYLSFPKVNKHIVADGHLLHGVIGPLNKIKPTKDKKRITLVVNYYVKKPIEPNCIHVPHDKVSLEPLTEEHIRLQDSVTKKASEILKMNYNQDNRNITVYRGQKPIVLTLSRDLKSMSTYSFNFSKKKKEKSEVYIKTSSTR